MVSVKRFVLDEPELFQASKEFVRIFADMPDPVLLVARKAKSLNAGIAWTLLGTALFQDCSYPEIANLLSNLYESFPDEKLWSLPVPSGTAINDVVKASMGGCHWSVFEHVPGIFWSVGLFVRHHPDLASWASSRTPEEMWRDLGEIYFMGKSNPRPKACAAIYRIIAPVPLGLGVVYRESRKMPPLPLTMGARRFLAILGPAKDDNFSGLDSLAKQKLANAYFRALSPGNPYLASHSLQFFLEDGNTDFICRNRTEHCRSCPLYELCNYAERHEKYYL